MSEHICGLCGQEAAGYASIWSAKLGETWFCHGDEDEEATCYERGQAAHMDTRDGRENASVDLARADGTYVLSWEVRWTTEATE